MFVMKLIFYFEKPKLKSSKIYYKLRFEVSKAFENPYSIILPNSISELSKLDKVYIKLTSICPRTSGNKICSKFAFNRKMSRWKSFNSQKMINKKPIVIIKLFLLRNSTHSWSHLRFILTLFLIEIQRRRT